MTSLLELRGVSKTFAASRGRRRRPTSTRAVHDLSLDLGPGEILSLVGESGAGKSTAGRLAMGIERPDGGQVLFEGMDVARLQRRQLRGMRRRTHLIFQDPYQSLHPGLRIVESVAEPLAIAGEDRRSRRQRAVEALDEVRLTPAARYAASYPHQLSGGQRQRVAFARALVTRPRLVVADEPVSMLDVSLQAGILELVAELRSRHGIAFIFITHDLAVARHVADRIAVMYRGRLVELGPAEEVVRDPLHPYTKALLAAVEDLSPPPPVVEPFPPGGQPCDVLGLCDASREGCLSAEPVLVEPTPNHQCACHVDPPTAHRAPLEPVEKGESGDHDE